MTNGSIVLLSKLKLLWISSIVVSLLFGASVGAFLTHATGVDHPVASKPIKVDYCFLFANEGLFRGQPVQTEAHYMLGIEGSGIGKDDCPAYDATYAGPPSDDPVGKQWEADIGQQPFPAEFDISFIGTIPSYPRYRVWLAEAKNGWRSGHHVPFVQIESLTDFKRTR